jgi:phage terminase large subunit-like protein
MVCLTQGQCEPAHTTNLACGKPIKLAPFQRAFVESVYDNPHGPTRRAILSIARKNLKTTLAACLTLNHLAGPSAQARPNDDAPNASREHVFIHWAPGAPG